ncbi:MAG: hypothetical protein V7603_2514, partial [Micromonosporaceae bacterium]
MTTGTSRARPGRNRMTPRMVPRRWLCQDAVSARHMLTKYPTFAAASRAMGTCAVFP